ncbi:two-component system sensor histidine kinase DesK [Antricoccus suffuscus]|uniref:Two-component system sensor histidine kinase DesK n=1 Tax=Antricoccus suffuscus TaxID=1629062 RepID=A0A2T1A2H6_9ACTN|nr:histidine kinase [Antricoccus suffuscus]PRZ42744.1 two-component system sensor histidine kinase DesK [Antricoccus suffuscus]
MAGVRQWWLGHSNPERFEIYTVWSLYFILLIEPFLCLGLVGRVAPGRMNAYGVYGVGTLVHAFLCILVLRASFEHVKSKRPVNRYLLVGLAAITLAMVVLAWFTFDWFVADDIGGRMWGSLIPVAFALGAACPLLARRQLWFGALAVPVVFAAAAVIGGPERLGVVAVVISSGAVILGAIFTVRMSIAMVGLVWEIDRSKHAGAALAVAEERLRFSRDLHDVLGRNLSVISVKSQLAAEFASRGRPEASDEMQEVRRIADDSLREVREVVRGYRKSHLDTELTGAQAILRAAGIDCTVDGSAGDLPVQAHDALGWVVREAVTNVIRHSAAGTCAITLIRRSEPDEIALVVWNDGARQSGPAVSGSGLAGLSERLGSVGGTLESAQPAPGEFRLTATIPAKAWLPRVNTDVKS